MSKLVTKSGLNTLASSLWNKIKAEFVKLSGNNVFTGENTFEDAYLSRKGTYVGDLIQHTTLAGGSKKVGKRNYTSHSNGNNGHVKSLIIKTNNLSIGTSTTVNVWSVRKGSDRSQDVLVEQVLTDHTVVVKEADKWGVSVEAPINKTYSVPHYFIYQLSDSRNLACATSQADDDRIYMEEPVTQDNIRNQGIQLNFTGIYGIIGDRVNLRDLASLEIQRLQYSNILEYNQKITGLHYNTNDAIYADPSWSTSFINVDRNETITVYTKSNSPLRVIFTDGLCNIKLNASNYNMTQSSNGWYHTTFNVPANTINSVPGNRTISKMAISYQHGSTEEQDIMIFRGRVTGLSEFIPHTDSELLRIESNVFSIGFNNKYTSLKSTTISDAIKEVDARTKHTIGELTSFYHKPTLDGNNAFRLGNVEYIYCGQNNKTISSAVFPELAQLLNKTGVAQFYVPYKADETDNHGNTLYHYVRAKIH